jgi:hypothetical protein
MAERLIGIRVAIVRCLDDVWPAFIECEFFDAHGECHRFHDKSVCATADMIDASTTYPYPGAIACQVISGPITVDNHNVYLIDTELPWHVSSLADKTRFEVRACDLVEWTFGKSDEQPWNEVP